ncbi:MAG: glycosyltransferase family 4 protein [Deltaproteobacteria bacterium]|nr:glycosyltransferase family 4 protein [Deltaproteobacteria bacterium]MDQ3297343.1 glycosyltransferase family 4 protein [Myxococcota bacterium]
MPRVLLTGFCAVPGPRRAGVQLRHVIRSLTPLHSVDLLVVREGDQAYVERQGSVRVLRVPTHDSDLRSQIQAFQRALKRQLDGADYDVVHCRDSWSAIPVLEARARLGYAVVYDLSRSPLGETTFDQELDAQYGRDEEACLLAADLVLAPTPAAVKALEGRGPRTPSPRVMLSPPGVDVDRFDWDEPSKDPRPRILYVGSIDPGRGVRVLVRAMAAISREVDCRLTIAGSMAPKFEQPLKDGIRELGLTDKIEVLGPIDHDQLPALYATATVCVVPAAADLTPNPTVVFPTKILEYMACRRAIVAPRRETVAQVVENNREALLFEPGDPIDLARKVLRLLGEPMLRERIAQHAYERVRRDFTASAARRALRNAYDVVTARFSIEAAAEPDDVPKVELLADDDFEATLFEEAPSAPPIDTALNKLESLDDALSQLDHHGGGTSSESIAAPPSSEPDDTMDRAPVPPGPRDHAWTVGALAAPPPPLGADDWVITNVAEAVQDLTDDARADSEAGTGAGDDGTPIEGVKALAPPLGIASHEGTFVAGEIDVPTPPPEREHDTPAVELTSALAPHDADPDTGSRTPPIERR